MVRNRIVCAINACSTLLGQRLCSKPSQQSATAATAASVYIFALLQVQAREQVHIL
jgi:hypothetical protein